MIITGPKFAIIGSSLFGKRWKRQLSLALEKSERTLTDYAAGVTNVPRDVRKRLAVLCHTRGTTLVRIALELDPEVAKAAGMSAVDMHSRPFPD